MNAYYIVDKDHPPHFDLDFFEATKARELAPGITWRFYKHWGQGYRAAEGIKMINGDRSGCVRETATMSYTSVPIVAQARLYESHKGKISAVLSYPGGIGFIQEYFWEIYVVGGIEMEDVERFSDEGLMEARIVELLGDPA